MRFASLVLSMLLALPAIASAQVELSLYAGGQMVDVPDVAIRDPATSLYDGVRATRWRSATFGIGLDLAHNGGAAKNASASDDIRELAVADGLNTFTLNAYRRWNELIAGATPYIGGGLGVSLPYVEVTDNSNETAGYQLIGPAATWIAGARVPLNDQWSLFGEYKGTYVTNTADLDSGGTFKADAMTNALNVGVSFNF